MFSKKLKELRISKGLTQEELGNIIFVSRSAIAKWEQGKGMPCKESLKLLSDYFEVPENELLKNDDALIIIDNIEKSSNKSKLIMLIVFSYIIIILSVLLCSFAFGENNSPRENEFFTNKYLRNMGLSEIEKIEGEKACTLSDGISYVCIIENHDVFEDYVEYVYDYLKSSNDISNLSYTKKFLKIGDNIKYSYKYYLFNSNELSDHISTTYTSIKDNKIVNSYEFYYTTGIDENRKIDDKVEVKCFKITSYVYDKVLHIAEDNRKYNLLIELFTINGDKNDVFEGNEYFDLSKIEINNQNINQYFEISELRYDYYTDPTFVICEKNHLNCNFIYLNVTVKLVAEDQSAIKEEDKRIVKEVKEFNVFMSESYSLLIDQNMFTIEADEMRNYFIEIEYEVLDGSRIYLLEEK